MPYGHNLVPFFSEFAGDCMSAPFEGPTHTFLQISQSTEKNSPTLEFAKKDLSVHRVPQNRHCESILMNMYREQNCLASITSHSIMVYKTPHVFVNAWDILPSKRLVCLHQDVIFAKVSVNGDTPKIYIHVEPINAPSFDVRSEMTTVIFMKEPSVILIQHVCARLSPKTPILMNLLRRF